MFKWLGEYISISMRMFQYVLNWYQYRPGRDKQHGVNKSITENWNYYIQRLHASLLLFLERKYIFLQHHMYTIQENQTQYGWIRTEPKFSWWTMLSKGNVPNRRKQQKKVLCENNSAVMRHRKSRHVSFEKKKKHRETFMIFTILAYGHPELGSL